jgi:hypothetical protein
MALSNLYMQKVEIFLNQSCTWQSGQCFSIGGVASIHPVTDEVEKAKMKECRDPSIFCDVWSWKSYM